MLGRMLISIALWATVNSQAFHLKKWVHSYWPCLFICCCAAYFILSWAYFTNWWPTLSQHRSLLIISNHYIYLINLLETCPHLFLLCYISGSMWKSGLIIDLISQEKMKFSHGLSLCLLFYFFGTLIVLPSMTDTGQTKPDERMICRYALLLFLTLNLDLERKWAWWRHGSFVWVNGEIMAA